MAEKSSKGWSDTEKVGLFLQIISKSGAIPWPDLTLPGGRTLKACQVMVDKEKQKIKKAREAAGEDIGDGSPKKRKAADTEGAKAKKVRKGKNAADTDEDDDEAAPEKKPKKGGRKKKTVKAQANEDVVKAEDASDDAEGDED